MDLLGANIRATVTQRWADAHGATLARALEERLFAPLLSRLDAQAQHWERTAAALEAAAAQLPEGD